MSLTSITKSLPSTISLLLFKIKTTCFCVPMEAACARSLDARATSCPRCANTVQQNLWLQEGVTNMERMALIVIGGRWGGRWGCVLQTVWAVGRAGGRQGLLGRPPLPTLLYMTRQEEQSLSNRLKNGSQWFVSTECSYDNYTYRLTHPRAFFIS